MMVQTNADAVVHFSRRGHVGNGKLSRVARLMTQISGFREVAESLVAFERADMNETKSAVTRRSARKTRGRGARAAHAQGALFDVTSRTPSSLGPPRRATARAVRAARAVERAPRVEMSSAGDGSPLGGIAQMRRTRCSHRLYRDQCKICIARLSCPHGKVPSRCAACGGGGICPHGRQRSQCVACGGNGICEHKNIRSRCKECGGSGVCEHGRRRYRCRVCIEAKRANESAKPPFSIRAHFLGEDGNAAASAEDFEREDEPEPLPKETKGSDEEEEPAGSDLETPIDKTRLNRDTSGTSSDEPDGDGNSHERHRRTPRKRKRHDERTRNERRGGRRTTTESAFPFPGEPIDT